MSTIYNQNDEATTKDLICCNCKYYNKSTEQKTILGIMHACDKGFICNSWNFTGGCKFFEREK